MTHNRIAFIGAGRLARVLANAWAAQGEHITVIASRRLSSAQAIANTLRDCIATTTAQDAVDQSDLVFLTVPDDAIASTTHALRWRAGQSVIHCSGATELSHLEHAKQHGAHVCGMHPMQTFADPEAALASLPGCTFALEAEAPLYDQLERMACSIGGVPLRLPPGARARYHAAGGFASQFINALLNEGIQIWRSFGADPQQAERALLALLKGTVASIERTGLAGSLAGPVSRGDIGTVKQHIDAMHTLPAETAQLYALLCLRTVELAVLSERITAQQANAFIEQLKPLLSDSMNETMVIPLKHIS